MDRVFERFFRHRKECGQTVLLGERQEKFVWVYKKQERVQNRFTNCGRTGKIIETNKMRLQRTSFLHGFFQRVPGR